MEKRGFHVSCIALAACLALFSVTWPYYSIVSDAHDYFGTAYRFCAIGERGLTSLWFGNGYPVLLCYSSYLFGRNIAIASTALNFFSLFVAITVILHLLGPRAPGWAILRNTVVTILVILPFFAASSVDTFSYTQTSFSEASFAAASLLTLSCLAQETSTSRIPFFGLALWAALLALSLRHAGALLIIPIAFSAIYYCIVEGRAVVSLVRKNLVLSIAGIFFLSNHLTWRYLRFRELIPDSQFNHGHTGKFDFLRSTTEALRCIPTAIGSSQPVIWCSVLYLLCIAVWSYRKFRKRRDLHAPLFRPNVLVPFLTWITAHEIFLIYWAGDFEALTCSFGISRYTMPIALPLIALVAQGVELLDRDARLCVSLALVVIWGWSFAEILPSRTTSASQTPMSRLALGMEIPPEAIEVQRMSASVDDFVWLHSPETPLWEGKHRWYILRPCASFLDITSFEALPRYYRPFLLLSSIPSSQLQEAATKTGLVLDRFANFGGYNYVVAYDTLSTARTATYSPYHYSPGCQGR